jgi:hypothetical protein
MTPLGKTIFATLSVAALIGATLALRHKSSPVAPRAQLTPAQLAEMQPPPKAPEPPRAVSASTASADSGVAEEPQDPDIEDGSGS